MGFLSNNKDDWLKSENFSLQSGSQLYAKQVGTGEVIKNRECTGKIDKNLPKNNNKFRSRALSLVRSQRPVFISHRNTAVLT